MKLSFAVLATFLCAASVPAQAPPPPQPQQPVQELDEAERIRLDVTRVNVLFAVTDKRGRFVTDLDKDQFEIFEGKHKQEILEFVRESDLPLRLAILVDTSNSIRDRFRFQQEAAVEFLKSVMRPAQDKAVVVGFDTSPEMVSDLSNDIDALEKSIRDMRPGGGTALYDAIFFACRDKLGQDQPRHKYRRAMVILSDGEDTQSRYSRDQALEMAHKADVIVYGISTNITRIQTDGDKVLKYLASETGGMTFFPFKVEDLAQSFENIANEMRHQYSVLYRPEPLRADGQYHEVNIRVKNRRDYTVRARKGYYAPKFN
ncbi:MAG: VWA domain-containing protein [Bryobacterales bacterium]|nr:VWA domain-containing protein [Bryobacterales bacterium]